ncbi:uncharacterized protein LOC119350900 [Triticum dicoccoides]|uniref:uncharacterized protein LOC119350900 n=1 Tax=Triticum dicoccoides TaxID=85692 RepID=UPI001890A659|nr:uncharacterized protein LOC119350900 [Triticum dicoccoides]
MAERFPGDGTAANGFGRRHLHEDEARLLFEVERRGKVHDTPPTARCGGPYFRRRHAEQLEATNSVVPSGRLNSEGRRQWWGLPGRTLESVLEYIEGGNTPMLEYPAPPSFSCRRGSSWTPRHTEVSSSLSGRSTVSTCLHPVKPEPQDTPVSHRTCSADVHIADPSPTYGRLVLVRPKVEPDLLSEYEAIAQRGFSDEEALNDDDEDAPGSSKPSRQPGEGCSRDGGRDDDDDCTQFYRRLGIWPRRGTIWAWAVVVTRAERKSPNPSSSPSARISFQFTRPNPTLLPRSPIPNPWRRKPPRGVVDPSDPATSRHHRGARGGGEEHGGLDVDDLISRLPDEVLGTVVSLLPTKDGARTQALSRRWRPLWLSPNAPLHLGDDIDILDLPISSILSDHPGPARRVSLYRRFLPDEIDGWFRSGSLSGLQDLEVVNLEWDHQLPLPSHALIRFAPTLRLLSLSHCRFPDLGVPSSFPHLKQLFMYDVGVSDNHLQSMIAGCVVLESVSLHIMGFGRLCITSLTLRSITFYGPSKGEGAVTFQELVIEDAPSLERLVTLDPYCGPATIHVIRAPKLEILGSLSQGISTLGTGTAFSVQKMVAVSLTSKMHTVKILVLDSIGPNLDSVVDFLKCFPCLQKLYIFPHRGNYVSNVREYDPLDPIECLEVHLKKVVLRNYNG